MLAALIIVFREVIEAGLIVGIVLAATTGVPGRGRAVSIGVLAGVLGACLVAGFAGELANLFQGSGQEFFNAGILLLAVVMLTWHNVWMASHGREMARELKSRRPPGQDRRTHLTALSIVVGVAVLREGSEVVLFLYGIAAQGGTTAAGMVAGGGLGLLGGALVSALMYFGLLTVPAGKLFQVTSWLITLLAAGMAAQAVAFLERANWLTPLDTVVWDSAWLLSETSIAGRTMHTLIGYTDQPTEMQILIYVAVLLTTVTLMRLTGSQRGDRVIAIS